MLEVLDIRRQTDKKNGAIRGKNNRINQGYSYSLLEKHFVPICNIFVYLTDVLHNRRVYSTLEYLFCVDQICIQ